MKYGVLGSGTVGRVISGKLAQLGHDVVIGTRNPSQTLARTEGDAMGNPPFRAWHAQHPAIKTGTFAEAAGHGVMVVNATSGMASLEALKMAGEKNLAGKILIDIANPLDFSRGMPPTLTVCNTDSLGEQIQRAYPAVKVVKTLNTMTANLMVNPALVAGAHDVFLCGNDATAKGTVAGLLMHEFGWPSVIDLGDITAARGMEMILPIWLRLMGVQQTPMFNFKIVK